jgi:hypothetical protein
MNMKNLVIAVLALVLALVLASCAGEAHKNLFPNAGDVGAVKIAGSASFDAATGTYTLTGAGTNMWQVSDEFFMTWREVTGDFTLSADVAFEGTGVNAHRKLGIIVRDGMDGGAVYADVAVHGDGLVSLQYRPAEDALTEEVVAQPTDSAIPTHITLTRKGNLIAITAEGTNPAQSSSEVSLTLPATCLVGLFVCSHESDVAETAHFSNVKFTE